MDYNYNILYLHKIPKSEHLLYFKNELLITTDYYNITLFPLQLKQLHAQRSILISFDE